MNYNTTTSVPQQVMEVFNTFFDVLSIHNPRIKIDHGNIFKQHRPQGFGYTQCLAFTLKRRGDLPNNILKINIAWDEEQFKHNMRGMILDMKIKGNLFNLEGICNTDINTIVVDSVNVDSSRASIYFTDYMKNLTTITTKTIYDFIEDSLDSYEECFKSRQYKVTRGVVHRELKSLILVEKNNVSRNVEKCHKILKNIETLIKFEISKNFKSIVATFKRKYERLTELLSKV